MADIFTSWKLNELEVPNRLVRSATWEGMASDDGEPSHESILLAAGLADGGVGLIITGHTFVNPQGRAHPRQTGAHIDAMVGPLTRVSDAVHKSNGLIAMQLSHAGGQSRADWVGGKLLGPSSMIHPANQQEVEGLSEDQIYDVIEDFAAAAARAQGAGFDAVQIHAAHGYLLSQFLSPITNQRQDEFGGRLENRARMLLYTYLAVRKAVGPLFPVLVKLNSADFVENGLSLEESIQVATWLSEHGVNAIEVSGGVAAAGKLAPIRAVKETRDQGYFLDNAKAIKEAVSCPVMVVGGFRSRALVEEALETVDAVSMCRPFIRQPDLANLWKQGSQEDATCVSCGLCLRQALKEGVACGKDLQEKSRGEK